MGYGGRCWCFSRDFPKLIAVPVPRVGLLLQYGFPFNISNLSNLGQVPSGDYYKDSLTLNSTPQALNPKP